MDSLHYKDSYSNFTLFGKEIFSSGRTDERETQAAAELARAQALQQYLAGLSGSSAPKSNNTGLIVVGVLAVGVVGFLGYKALQRNKA